VLVCWRDGGHEQELIRGTHRRVRRRASACQDLSAERHEAPRSQQEQRPAE